jgi:outer membrane protein assembly factor BamB
MRLRLIFIVCCCALGPRAVADEAGSARDTFWPQWRGPLMTGHAPHADPPVEWSESDNIRWKVEIPGRGHATPIVWGDRVYIQTAVRTDRKVEPKEPTQPDPPPEDRRGDRGRNWMGSVTPTHVHAFTILALDRQTGKIVWQRVVREELPHEGGHKDASQASNSPVTDGTNIIAYFGSRGLYGLDMEGHVLWEQNLGRMRTRRGFGEGSSPALHGDTVVVNWDHEDQSFIAAFDKKTGEPRWKVDRDEPTSWSTPLAVTVDGRSQVIASATNRIRSYDLAQGDLLWNVGGMTLNVVPTPVAANGTVYLASGFRGSALIAVRYPGAEADITGTPAVAWVYEGKNTPYVPSTLLDKEMLYFLSGNNPILSCVDARTGRAHYTERLEGLQGVYASPVSANGHVYITGLEGTTAVVQHGPEFRVLATNSLDDGFAASPAVVEKEIYLRGHKHLYCIASE